MHINDDIGSKGNYMRINLILDKIKLIYINHVHQLLIPMADKDLNSETP